MIKKLYTLICAISLITALPTFGMEENANLCNHCQIYDGILIQKEHVLNKLEGTCSYILCDDCQATITGFINASFDKKTHKKLYDSCDCCAYFDTAGLDRKWKPITYPCDNCHQEKSILNRLSMCTNGKECLHILCEECNNVIWAWKKPINVKAISNCEHCYYFYNEYKKQCWQPTDRTISSNTSAFYQRASRFKREYPNRILPDITDATTLHQNPDTPPILGNFVIDNKIKWLGAAGIAAIACYGIYTWWKGEEIQEKDVDDEQDLEKEEQTA